MGIGKLEIGELVACPLIGALHIGRAGQALADAIHEAAGDFHHL